MFAAKPVLAFDELASARNRLRQRRVSIRVVTKA
jgi:hypothetical protein